MLEPEQHEKPNYHITDGKVEFKHVTLVMMVRQMF